MNRKGDTIAFETVIFIVLNLVFFAVMILFILNSSYGALIYEQSYAKEIALLLDESKPGMTITIDMTDAIKIAQKYKFDKQQMSSDEILTKIVTIDKEKNIILVSLSGRGKGYNYKYFSDYDVSLASKGVVLQIGVGEKNGG